MSVSFSLAKHLAKPGDKTSDSKYYACTQINDSISLKMFAGLIEKQTTVSRADCTAGDNSCLYQACLFPGSVAGI